MRNIRIVCEYQDPYTILPVSNMHQQIQIYAVDLDLRYMLQRFSLLDGECSERAALTGTCTTGTFCTFRFGLVYRDRTRSYCNYFCNLIQRPKTIRETTMPRIRKIEQDEKSTKSRKLQKNKTKHNMYQLVEVAYHVSTQNRAHIRRTSIIYVHSIPYVRFIRPVSYITHVITKCPAYFIFFITNTSWYDACSMNIRPLALLQSRISQVYQYVIGGGVLGG